MQPRREPGSMQKPIGNGVDRLHNQADAFAGAQQKSSVQTVRQRIGSKVVPNPGPGGV
jgi:hypothetical protein